MQEHAQYDVNHVLSELAAPVSQRRVVRPAPQVVYAVPRVLSRRDSACGTDDKFEQRARRRGWKSLNRWVIFGWFRHWENISHVDAHGRDTRVGEFLGGRVSATDVDCCGFNNRLNIFVKDTIRETRNFVLPMLFERLDRMSLKGLSLITGSPGLRKFDVVWARNCEEYAYCVWASSSACIALEDHISELMNTDTSSVPRVVRAVLSWRARLPLHPAVPWERYLKDVDLQDSIAESQLSSPECYSVALTPAQYGRSGDIIIRPSMVDRNGKFTGYSTLPTSLRDELETYVPLAWRRLARTRRHRYERIIAENQCQVQ